MSFELKSRKKAKSSIISLRVAEIDLQGCSIFVITVNSVGQHWAKCLATACAEDLLHVCNVW